MADKEQNLIGKVRDFFKMDLLPKPPTKTETKKAPSKPERKRMTQVEIDRRNAIRRGKEGRKAHGGK